MSPIGHDQHVDVVHSIISAASIGAAVAARYQLGRITGCQLVSSTFGDMYRLSAESGDYYARLSAVRCTTQQEPFVELSALHYLHARGAPVVAPVLSSSGDPFAHVRTPEGQRVLAVFTKAPGRYIEFTASDFQVLGSSMAAIHQVALTKGSEFGGRKLDLPFLLDDPLARLQRLALPCYDDLLSLSASVRSSILAGCSRGARQGFCHGDAWGNINIGPNRTATFFDFELGGVGWLVYDVATVKWGLWFEIKARDVWEPLWEAFLTAYRRGAELAPAEADLISPFTIARDVWSMGNLLANADRWGHRRLTAEYFINRIQRTLTLM